MMSSLYVVANDANSLLKIGYADNLKNRIAGMNTGSPVGLRLVHFLYFVDGMIASDVEREVHKTLASYRRKGEWFEVNRDQAGDAIALAVNARRIKWWSEAERRKVGAFVQKSLARYTERQRFFGT